MEIIQLKMATFVLEQVKLSALALFNHVINKNYESNKIFLLFTGGEMTVKPF